MIEVFRGWVSSMLCLGIFVTIIQLIMPKANIKKYIYSLIGVVTIVTIIGPVVNLLKSSNIEDGVSQVLSNISNGDGIEKVELEKYKNKKEEAIKEGFIENMKSDIKNTLLAKGVKVKNVEIILSAGYDITRVEVNIKKMNSSNSTLDNVNKVVNYINETYGLEYEKIVVIEEGT